MAGAGVGLVNPALATTAIGVVPPQRSGMASGINNTFRQIGTATGIAALGAIFENTLTSQITPRLAGLGHRSHGASKNAIPMTTAVAYTEATAALSAPGAGSGDSARPSSPEPA